MTSAVSGGAPSATATRRAPPGCLQLIETLESRQALVFVGERVCCRAATDRVRAAASTTTPRPSSGYSVWSDDAAASETFPRLSKAPGSLVAAQVCCSLGNALHDLWPNVAAEHVPRAWLSGRRRGESGIAATPRRRRGWFAGLSGVASTPRRRRCGWFAGLSGVAATPRRRRRRGRFAGRGGSVSPSRAPRTIHVVGRGVETRYLSRPARGPVTAQVGRAHDGRGRARRGVRRGRAPGAERRGRPRAARAPGRGARDHLDRKDGRLAFGRLRPRAADSAGPVRRELPVL